MVYFAAALVIIALGEDVEATVRRPLAALALLAGGLSLSLHQILLAQVPVALKVAVYSLLGLSLCLTCVLSCLTLIHVCSAMICGFKGVAMISTSGLQMLWLVGTAAVQGVFYGVVFGLLEATEKHPRIADLPRADRRVVLPAAALLGGLVGVRVELLRLSMANPYTSVDEEVALGLAMMPDGPGCPEAAFGALSDGVLAEEALYDRRRVSGGNLLSDDD